MGSEMCIRDRLPPQVGAKDFNQIFRKQFADDWEPLNEEWQLFVDQLVYGYDLPREAVDFRPGEPLPADGTTVKVRADRGWQSTGIELEAGKRYQLAAQGRYQVATEPKPWLSTPAGITIRYWKGKPLGALLAAVRPADGGETENAFLTPLVIGMAKEIAPISTGTLYLRINDSPAERSDNSGSADVRISPE